MTALKDNLVAQVYCRQLSELIAAAKISKLASNHMADLFLQIKSGMEIGVKDRSENEIKLTKVSIRPDDIELFIKELQEALILLGESNEGKIETSTDNRQDNSMVTRKELKAHLGISDSTVDRFFKYLKESKTLYFKEPLHGVSDRYSLSEMRKHYLAYLAQISNKPK